MIENSEVWTRIYTFAPTNPVYNTYNYNPIGGATPYLEDQVRSLEVRLGQLSAVVEALCAVYKRMNDANDGSQK